MTDKLAGLIAAYFLGGATVVLLYPKIFAHVLRNVPQYRKMWRDMIESIEDEEKRR